jgi:hypothetical protein
MTFQQVRRALISGGLLMSGAASSLALSAAPAQAGTLDQSQTSAPSSASFYGSFRSVQTFTAGRTGQLDQVDLSLEKDCDRNGVTVQIRTVSGDGTPTNTTLATAAIPDARIPSTPPQFVSVTFTSPASVAAGTKYAIVLSAPTATPCPVTAFPPYWWGFADGNPYPPGQRLSSSDGGMNWNFTSTDHSFKTYVADPPPPPPPPPPASDTDPPETRITKGAPKKTEKTRVKFKFRSDEPGSTFECKRDKRPWKGCSSPKKVKRLDDGKHKFKVRATDLAGNVDPTAAKDRFKVVD